MQRRYYFDTVNCGYVYTYDAGGINTGATDGEVNDDNTQSETPKPGVIENWLEGLKGDVINTKYDYYSLSYNPDGTKDGRIPVQTYIGGNVYCQGRMIIAPDSNTSYVNYKNVEKLGISTYFSNPDIYIGSKVVKNDKFVLNDSGAFLSQIKDKWQQITGKSEGEAFDFGTVKLDVTYGRFDTNELVANPDTLKEKQNFSMESFIEAYKAAYNEQKLSNSESIKRLKEKFEDLDKDGYSYLTGDDYTEFGGKYYDPKSQTDKDAKNIAGFNTPKFNETSNLYIQNSPIRKGTSCGDIEHKNSNGVDPCTLEKYASDDKYRVVENVDEKVTTRTKVNGIFYTAALSVRYCEITVNNVFCDGTISVLSSDIGDVKEKVHFVNSAAVNVKNNYLCSDSVKNELKKVSIKDFLRSLNLSDDEILKEYFGVDDDDDDDDDDDNAFKGETNFVFNVQDDSIQDRKVVIIRAHYEMTETVTWNNDERWRYVAAGHFENGEWISLGWHKLKDTNWHKDDVDYSGGKFVADLVYCIEGNATDKLITSDGEYIEYKDRASLNPKLTAEEEALVKYLYESRNSGDYKYALSLTQTAFIDFRTTPITKDGKTYDSFEKYFKEEHIAGFDTATNDPRTTTGNISYTKGKYNVVIDYYREIGLYLQHVQRRQDMTLR